MTVIDLNSIEMSVASLSSRLRTAFVLMAAEHMSDRPHHDRSIFTNAWNALCGDSVAAEVIASITYRGDMSGSARQVIDLMSGRITIDRAVFDACNSGIDDRFLRAVAAELESVSKHSGELAPALLRLNVKARLA